MKEIIHYVSSFDKIPLLMNLKFSPVFSKNRKIFEKIGDLHKNGKKQKKEQNFLI